jgi:hypothetical protein
MTQQDKEKLINMLIRINPESTIKDYLAEIKTIAIAQCSVCD